MIKDVVTIPYNAPVEDAGDLMMKNRVGSLIVMNNKKPVGILTERDFVKLVSSDFLRNSGVIVDDIIGPKLITATPSTTFTMYAVEENSATMPKILPPDEKMGLVCP